MGTYKHRNGEKQFAAGLSFFKLFWIFFIGCVAGVVIETIWCLVTTHTLENRTGLIYGPFNPVYGFGALILTVCLFKLSKKRDLWIFLGSMALGGLFEFLCSLFQEMAFGTVSWEYSGTQLNFDGRTNIMFAFFWGVLGLVWMKEGYPRLSRLIEKIPVRVGTTLSWTLVVFMVFNMAISGLAVMRQSQRREGVTPINGFSQFLDRHYNDEFLKTIYPNMRIVEPKQ